MLPEAGGLCRCARVGLGAWELCKSSRAWIRRPEHRNLGSRCWTVGPEKKKIKGGGGDHAASSSGWVRGSLRAYVQDPGASSHRGADPKQEAMRRLHSCRIEKPFARPSHLFKAVTCTRVHVSSRPPCWSKVGLRGVKCSVQGHRARKYRHAPSALGPALFPLSHGCLINS